jgi:pantoate--beta-alanine ligase
LTGLCAEPKTLRANVAAWRACGQRVALVPTMGALHRGHMSLVAAARQLAERVVVTIFVNPTQFAPHEDFATYPRDLEADRARIDAAGADLVYAPDLPAMYPDGFATSIHVEGPAIAGLEDRFRPSHFAGVATIVVKLLTQAQPDVALFGEKDFQQLKVIERVTADLDLPVAIGGVPIVREPDGLALSSRNLYLSAEERARAPTLHATLLACADTLAREAPEDAALATARRRLVESGFVVDYVEARRADTLGPRQSGHPARLLAAARLGRTRLLDNVDIGLSPPIPRGTDKTG